MGVWSAERPIEGSRFASMLGGEVLTPTSKMGEPSLSAMTIVMR